MIAFNQSDNHSFMELEVIDALKTVIDPELYVNIIDLGLVYSISLDDAETSITIAMTLSSKFCPMGESILSAVRNCLERFFPGFAIEVELVWEPVWNYSFISEPGRKQLGV